jgi:hypothetical protein
MDQNLRSAILETLQRGPKKVVAVHSAVVKRYPSARFEAIAAECDGLERAGKIEFRFKPKGEPHYALIG